MGESVWMTAFFTSALQEYLIIRLRWPNADLHRLSGSCTSPIIHTTRLPLR